MILKLVESPPSLESVLGKAASMALRLSLRLDKHAAILAGDSGLKIESKPSHWSQGPLAKITSGWLQAGY